MLFDIFLRIDFHQRVLGIFSICLHVDNRVRIDEEHVLVILLRDLVWLLLIRKLLRHFWYGRIGSPVDFLHVAARAIHII